MAKSLAQVFVEGGFLSDHPLTAIDVGCSGGIISELRLFEPNLRVVGFDPLESEIERLRRAEAHHGSIYECSFIRAQDGNDQAAITSPHEFDLIARSSAGRFMEDRSYDYPSSLTSGQHVRLGTRQQTLAGWLADHPDWTIDFIKTDTDGYDLDVLHSLETRIDEILMAHVEVFFDVSPRPGNVFAAVAEYMHAHDFRLYDLDVARYGRAALPLPFQWDIPAQTISGQVTWGTAIFARDLVGPGPASPVAVIKLAALLDAFGLPDCALELLEAHATDVVELGVDLQSAGDLLARRGGWDISLADLRHRFRTDPESLFPSSLKESRADNGQRAVPLSLRRNGAQVTIAVGASGAAARGDGWWGPETDGCWMSSTTAELLVDLPDGAVVGDRIVIECWALSGAQASHSVGVALDGQPLRLEETNDREIKFSIPSAVQAGPCKLLIHYWPLDRPSDLGFPGDDREVGLRVASVALQGIEYAP